MKKPKIDFYFEMTDTFGGELNYSWIRKFKVKAKSIRGALQIISRMTGFNFRKDFNNQYKAKNACIALYEIELCNELDNAQWNN